MSLNSFVDLCLQQPYPWNAEVFNLLKGHEVARRGARHLTLLGHTVCNRGFMRLVGIGKSRFRTISKAINEGLVRCPMDARFLPKEPKPQSPKRQAVWDYLWALYEQAAERLPDGNTVHSNKRPRQGAFKYDDPSMSRDEVRHLPPGTFADYLRLCRSELPDYKISRQLFCSARAST